MRDSFSLLWLLPFLWCACIPASAVLPVARGTIGAQADITDSISELDAMCQARASTQPQLLECRAARDKGRAALRRQVEAWKAVVK